MQHYGIRKKEFAKQVSGCAGTGKREWLTPSRKHWSFHYAPHKQFFCTYYCGPRRDLLQALGCQPEVPFHMSFQIIKIHLSKQNQRLRLAFSHWSKLVKSDYIRSIPGSSHLPSEPLKMKHLALKYSEEINPSLPSIY